MLSCPPCHLILIRSLVREEGNNYYSRLTGEKMESALLILQCHQGTITNLSLMLAQQCPFGTGSRFSFSLCVSFFGLIFSRIPMASKWQAHYIYGWWSTVNQRLQSQLCCFGSIPPNSLAAFQVSCATAVPCLQSSLFTIHHLIRFFFLKNRGLQTFVLSKWMFWFIFSCLNIRHPTYGSPKLI